VRTSALSLWMVLAAPLVSHSSAADRLFGNDDHSWRRSKTATVSRDHPAMGPSVPSVPHTVGNEFGHLLEPYVNSNTFIGCGMSTTRLPRID
jgi:hypothetical protein